VRITGAVRVEVHDELPSTSDRLSVLARDGAAPFTVVVARAQSAGRGRSGRSWWSERDAGLWISALLPPPPDGPPGVTSLAVGVATARAVEGVAGLSVGLKWPNDLWIRSSPDGPGWGKVGGILCEGVRQPRGESSWGTVAGVGINLRRPSLGEGPPPPGRSVAPRASEGESRWRGTDPGVPVHAAFLEEAAGKGIGEEELAQALLEELRGWADPPPDRLEGRLREEWEARDLLAGLRVRTAVVPEGVARGITPEGWLQIADDRGGLHPVRGGSVRLVSGPMAEVP
jgi:BirA family transcriptional regulator, biotin operon repressor / biotin---[acetyl-CoA-carboxylase] ligase